MIALTEAKAMERCDEILATDARGFGSGVCIAHTFTLAAIINQLESHLTISGENAKNHYRISTAIAHLKQAKDKLEKQGQEFASENEYEAFVDGDK